MQLHAILVSGMHILAFHWEPYCKDSISKLIQLDLNAHFKIAAKKISNWNSKPVNPGETDQKRKISNGIQTLHRKLKI